MADSTRVIGKPKTKRPKRLAYNRAKQQEYRLRIKDAIATCQAQVVQLEAELRRVASIPAPCRNRPRVPTLSWQDVAEALADSVDDVLTDYASLVRERDARQELLRQMLSFVEIHHHVGRSALSGTDRNWTNVTLLTHAASRRLGMEWITGHLYHNTERMLARFAFPPPLDAVDDCVVDASDLDCMQYAMRYQREIRAPLDATAALIRTLERQGDPIDAHLWPADGSARYLRGANVYELSREVAGTHGTRRRVVFVRQNIHDDATLPSFAVQRNRMSWIVLDEVAGGASTNLRVLSVHSHHFYTDTGQFLPLADEAKLWRSLLDSATPAHLQWPRYIQHMTAVARSFTQRLFANLETKRPTLPR
ncbi:hypothetical protein H310_10828 [Aphanomyces invadans]|uniref:BZIP domain-containing protein n=1 Tax=Aphanomyces invadans TaxID=157072 RepID=A0A024TQX3_9STRA|nr:hypothetical protein H310_10828 [Aphanomyces invadans]ETV95762.1 hypothetical protein H310_10828 [Aphanomyces invadans]|eukprot:XP_008875513.1 hypothetical protein H310_10828 [Aphanomyces invadans]